MKKKEKQEIIQQHTEDIIILLALLLLITVIVAGIVGLISMAFILAVLISCIISYLIVNKETKR